MSSGAPATRYEAVVVVDDGPGAWARWVGPSAAAAAEGLLVGVVAAETADLPQTPDGGDLAGPGAVFLAASASPGCAVLDDHGVRVGRREAPGTAGGGPGEDTYGAGALDWVRAELWSRGVGPSETLVVSADAAAPALAAQAALRRERALPAVRPEAGWELVAKGFDVERRRVDAALFSLAGGVVGTSGAPLASHPDSHHRVLVLNAYVGEGSAAHLLTAPAAAQLPVELADPPELTRTLDLRTGLLREECLTTDGPLAAVRFASLARPGTVVVRAEGPLTDDAGAPLRAPEEDPAAASGAEGPVVWMQVRGDPGGVTAAALDTVVPGGTAHRILDRVAVYRASPPGNGRHGPPPPPAVAAEVTEAADAGFEALLAEHRRAWAGRWEDADVVIEGDPELQRAVRFSLFHLMANVPDSGEAAVGARGLSGPGYRGHVFWDADTFTLPFLAATHPAAARAMLEYRLRRLPVAMALARESGRQGARFPWESAQTGRDVTPTSARDRTGAVVPIRTGALEEHIVAQVAWAACWYADWTGDQTFARGPGLALLVETARYWASRIRMDRDGAAHIYGVIGPDEYHEPVDDNAFTNVAARWNLRRAARVSAATGSPDVGPAERAQWLQLADALVDGYDPDTGLYEQFSGFFGLEPLIISEVSARRPIAADLLLGAGRVRRSQVLKQADVLMLHHLLPEEVEPDSLEPNLRYYEPRTSHGSSLSPAIHASLLARSRDYRGALDMLRIAGRVDLDDLTGSTAGGLHVATMGGLWQALALGFAGLRPRDGRLSVDPRLPPEWARLEVRVRFRGARVVVGVEHDGLEITAEAPTPVTVQGRDHQVGPRGLALRRRGPSWEER